MRAEPRMKHGAAKPQSLSLFAPRKATLLPVADCIAADSGNGGHLLYRIDLPVDDGGLVERCLEALDVQFSGDGVNVDLTVFNAAQIWKLYGAAAGKGDSIPDRPHRLAQILEYPAEVYPVPRDLLEALAAKGPKPEMPQHSALAQDFRTAAVSRRLTGC